MIDRNSQILTKRDILQKEKEEIDWDKNSEGDLKGKEIAREKVTGGERERERLREKKRDRGRDRDRET